MRIQVFDLDARTYEPHELHRTERAWTETNCYVDLWIEVLHSLGLDPVAASAFTLSSDFEGDQWTMFKYPTEDLRALFGLELSELNVWRPLVDHIVEQLSFGRLLTVDVDAWYLPDTHGVSYMGEHQKTTIMPQMIDIEAKVLGYFHNAGYFELEGEDFDGLLRLGAHQDPPSVLPPYVEVVKLERMHRGGEGLVDAVRMITQDHLARRPTSNPMGRFKDRLSADLGWLAGQDVATFHRYAFGTCRQCGSNAELAASFVDWLDGYDGGLSGVAERFRAVSDGAKALQFGLARVLRGRQPDLDGPLDEMAKAWEDGMEALVGRYGG